MYHYIVKVVEYIGDRNKASFNFDMELSSIFLNTFVDGISVKL